MTRKKLLIAGAGLLLIAGIIVAVIIYSDGGKNGAAYATILPSGKTIKSLGGWKILRPPSSDAVYTYTDTLENVTINVTEQPLPISFTNDGTKLAKLAKGYDATNTVEADGITVFIGNSSQGPQSVIFSKKNLLILIKSTSPITNSAWAKYVSSLH